MGADDVGMVVVIAVAVVMVVTLAAGATLVIRDTIRRRGRWGINLRQVRCPECDEPAPEIRKPKNTHQMLWGGCTCEVCGLEYDKWGRPVPEAGDADT